MEAPMGVLIAELRVLAKKNALGFRAVVNMLISCIKIGYHHHTLKQFVKEHGEISTIYCYWNNERSYAASLLKRDGSAHCVVSRIHRYDLYEEYRPDGYMPFKSYFVNRFDEVFPLSEKAANYLELRYGARPERLTVARLGVILPAKPQFNSVNRDRQLFLLSVSNCVPIKRIERIIDALVFAAKGAPNIQFTWTHIGGGPLRLELERYAFNKFANLSNMSADFLGEISNSEVRRFYADNRIDIFVNASDSEGVPVAIMEAMSFGIPVIAPDVGSVSELVGDDTGWLMPVDNIDENLGPCLLNATVSEKITEKGRQARSRIETSFDAERNYPQFVRYILQTVAGDEIGE